MIIVGYENKDRDRSDFIVCENIDGKTYGEDFVDLLNSQTYGEFMYKLVEDDYVLYYGSGC